MSLKEHATFEQLVLTTAHKLRDVSNPSCWEKGSLICICIKPQSRTCKPAKLPQLLKNSVELMQAFKFASSPETSLAKVTPVELWDIRRWCMLSAVLPHILAAHRWCVGANSKVYIWTQKAAGLLPLQSGWKLNTSAKKTSIQRPLGFSIACTFLNCLACRVHTCNRKQVLSVGRLKGWRQQTISCLQYGGRSMLLQLHRNGRQTRKRTARGSISTGPTDNFPSSSDAPGIALSSNTERRRSKRGEREREKNRTYMWSTP